MDSLTLCNPMTLAPKRRWTFTLRTMFVVVTVLCCWLAWNVNAVQKRKHLIDWASFHGVVLNRDFTWDGLSPAMRARKKALNPQPVAITRRMPKVGDISWFRRGFLNDQAVTSISIPYVWRNEAEAHQIDASFPEAKIIVSMQGAPRNLTIPIATH